MVIDGFWGKGFVILSPNVMYVFFPPKKVLHDAPFLFF